MGRQLKEIINDLGYPTSVLPPLAANHKYTQGLPKKRILKDSKGYWKEDGVRRGGLEDPIFLTFILGLRSRPVIVENTSLKNFGIGTPVTLPATTRHNQTPTPPRESSKASRTTSVVTRAKKETPSAKKVTVESLPESWGNITLDLAKAELQDYYNQVGELKDVSKMSNEDFINEFNNYLEYQNSKLNDLYYLTKPLVIQLLELPKLELPKYANVDLSRKEVRDILNLYGYNPYRDFTASQRRAIRKHAAGNKDLDMEWLRNFDHTLNGESLYDFFVTYRKRGGKLISNNIVERFKNRYKL